MTTLVRRFRVGVSAGILCLGMASSAGAQPVPTMSPMSPMPPSSPASAVIPVSTNPPALAAPSTAAPSATHPAYLPVSPLGISNSQPPASTGSLPGPSVGIPGQVIQTPPAPTSPGATPKQEPLLSSQPPPFQVTPETPPAGQDPNFYEGNRPVQDLSALLPGRFKETRYKWYGFVRMDAIYDFRPMASTDSFVTSAIPIPQGRGQNFVMTPRYSRIGWDTETPLKELDWTIKTRIEVDFFNGNTSGLFGSFPLRLRFAWADFGPFLIGQAASLFMDYDVFPNVLDYQGPGGMVLMRQPIAAVHFPVGKKLKVSAGVEQPYSDIQWFENGVWIVNPGSGIITTPGVGRNVQDLPDFTANVRYEGDYGHMQVAGIGRKLTFQPGFGDSAFDEFGYGINVTGSFHPWACLHGTPKSGDCATPWSKSRFLYQFAAGHGINRYIQDVNGLGLDATFDPFTGFRPIPSYGWFVSYEQWWGKRWASVFTYGQNACDLTDTLPGDTYERANYVSANIIWLPVDRMGVGLEYLYGMRRNKDGQNGDNSRIQMAFQYRF